ncbi:MAG: J domain-containing protein [Thaumarchaeota archaeon]|nr:J domain-containing protein [Nitrososphaerota archaeon]
MTMELDRCYRELGVRSDADLSEVKVAFRRLSLKYHPDRNWSPEAGAKFSAVAEAFDTIMSSKGVDAWKRTDDRKDVVDERFARKLNFEIMTDKEVTHSVPAELFEQELRKRFNPTFDPGTFCKIGKRWFEISDKRKAGIPLLHSGRREILIEWYKAPNGVDRWKEIAWDDFWSYAHQFATSTEYQETPTQKA